MAEPPPADNALGVYLARLRRRKGVSQLNLAHGMGWRGTSPIVEIEAGRRRPDAETIKRWVAVLGWGVVEETHALGLGRYIAHTTFPHLAQISRVLDAMADNIRRIPYPAYVVDYNVNLWLINEATHAITGRTHPVELLRQHANLFDVLFNSRLDVRSRHHSILNTEREQIRRFKQLNIFRQHEPYYLAYPEYMRGRLDLPDEDYQRFAGIWNEISVDTVNPTSTVGLVWSWRLPDESLVYFQVYPGLMIDLMNIFLLVVQQPYDHPDYPDNRARIDEYLKEFRERDMPVHKLWEIGDPQVVLNSFG